MGNLVLEGVKRRAPTPPEPQESSKEIEIQARELSYRGEGNSSLVVALSSCGQVIRLLKEDVTKAHSQVYVLDHLRVQIDFSASVLSTCLSRVFYQPPQLVRLTQQQLTSINELVKDKRPSFRLKKKATKCGFALLMPDYCLPLSIPAEISTNEMIIAIEIKPKQGFLPKAEQLRGEACFKLKSQICRYTLGQYYKLGKDSITKLSNYCPLDLFSGCPFRMWSALDELFRSPQNNLRIFADAQLVFGDQKHSIEPINAERLAKVLERFLPHCGAVDDRLENKDELAMLLMGNPKEDELESGFGSETEDNVGLPPPASECLEKPKKETKLALDRLTVVKYFIYQALARSPANATPNKTRFIGVRQHFERPGSLSNVGGYFRTFIDMFNTIDYVAEEEKLKLAFPEELADIDSMPSFFGDDHQHYHKSMDTGGEDDHSLPCRFHTQTNLCCFGEKKHHLAEDCVLATVLDAQMLDKLDSYEAAQSLLRLCRRFQTKRRHLSGVHHKLTDSLASLTQKELSFLVTEFIDENEAELDKLWAFLISMTAKDCSIIIAVQRVTSKFGENIEANTGNATELASIPVVNGLNLDDQYCASVAIADLDFKPGFKILNTLVNDYAMVKAFHQHNSTPAFLSIEP